jgi:uncharacterized membrane protein (DUF373 family)
MAQYSKPDASEADRLSARILIKAEEYIYIVAGYILIVAAAGLLVTAVYEMIMRLLDYNYTAAMVHLLDRVLLVLMLAEIIYTIQRIAHTRKLEATPFLIVGIIAAVRRILIVTAESIDEVDLSNTAFQGTLAELALLSVMILLLSISMLLIHKHNAE